MSEKYLDFNEISQNVRFIDLLNWKNIPYVKKGGELKGETKGFKFIVNIEKNLFFSPGDDNKKGSVINFLSEFENINLREAAKQIKSYFLDDPGEEKKEIPDLELFYTIKLSDMGIPEDVANQYEIGLVKQRSIMKGRIAFKVYDENGEVSGYVGWHPEKDNWLFPKHFKRPVYNVQNIEKRSEVIVTTSLFDCLFLIAKGYTSCASLIAKSMTNEQEGVLSRFDRIILLHPEPENILIRLSKYSFVKAPEIVSPLKSYTDEEIMAFVS